MSLVLNQLVNFVIINVLLVKVKNIPVLFVLVTESKLQIVSVLMDTIMLMDKLPVQNVTILVKLVLIIMNIVLNVLKDGLCMKITDVVAHMVNSKKK